MGHDQHLPMSNNSILFKKDLGPMTHSNLEYFGKETHDNDIEEIVKNQVDPVHILGKFDGDWLDDLDVAVFLARKKEYNSSEFYPDYLYVVDVNEYPGRMPKIEKMAELLGFLPGATSMIQMQRPGCLISRHKDPWEIFQGKNGTNGIRVLITLTHWEYGQVLCFNNHQVKEWKPGTIIYTDYPNVHHFTANASWHTRPILQITGQIDHHLRESINNKDYLTFHL